MIAPTSRTVVAIGVDVGGTHLRAAAVHADGTTTAMVRRPSQVDDPAALVASIASAVDEVAATAPDTLATVPVGLGFAGLVTRDGRFLYGPNVGVGRTPLRRSLEDATGRSVVVINDATAAVLAEQRVGAARGHDDVVMLTLGTGVGGGVVSGGQLLLGAHGFAGELGHVIVEDGGRPAASGILGTLEGYASGSAVVRASEQAVERGVAGARALDAPGVVAAAAAGEAWAVMIVEDVGHWAAVALASIAAVLDPTIVVIGGGAGVAMTPWILPVVQRELPDLLMGGGLRPVIPVVVAELGDDAGLVGAAFAASDAAPGPALGSGDEA
jgi:glucokinase